MKTRFHHCPNGDFDCPYYMPTITNEKDCGLEDAPTECDSWDICGECGQTLGGFEECSNCCDCGECDECGDFER
jgi:hypothetical protein